MEQFRWVKLIILNCKKRWKILWNWMFVTASHFTLGVLIPEAVQQFRNEGQC